MLGVEPQFRPGTHIMEVRLYKSTDDPQPVSLGLLLCPATVFSPPPHHNPHHHPHHHLLLCPHHLTCGTCTLCSRSPISARACSPGGLQAGLTPRPPCTAHCAGGDSPALPCGRSCVGRLQARARPHHRLAAASRGEPWPTAAPPVEDPCCRLQADTCSTLQGPAVAAAGKCTARRVPAAPRGDSSH